MSAVRALPPDIVDLVESGVAILVGTRDRANRPSTVRAFGAKVSTDKRAVTVFLPQAVSARVKSDLDDNRQIAIGFSRPFDHFSVQLKGEVDDLRPASSEEKSIPDRYLASLVEQLYLIGLPRSLVQRANIWPAWAARFQVRDLFVQTPGPEAGKRLELK